MPSLEDEGPRLPKDPDAGFGPDGFEVDPAVRPRPRVSPVVVLAVAGGGIVGAIGRYAIARGIPTPSGGFPWATFLINTTGSLALGFLILVLVHRLPKGHLSRPMLCTGVLGAYTTFSTFEVDTLNLIRAGQVTTALIYLASSIVVGLLAVWLGITAARLLFRIERHAATP